MNIGRDLSNQTKLDTSVNCSISHSRLLPGVPSLMIGKVGCISTLSKVIALKTPLTVRRKTHMYNNWNWKHSRDLCYRAQPRFIHQVLTLCPHHPKTCERVVNIRHTPISVLSVSVYIYMALRSCRLLVYSMNQTPISYLIVSHTFDWYMIDPFITAIMYDSSIFSKTEHAILSVSIFS